jgi:hypothetical protein
MRSQFEDYYSNKVVKHLHDKTEVVVDLEKMTSLKPLSAKWLVSAIDYLKVNTKIVFNGFKSRTPIIGGRFV